MKKKIFRILFFSSVVFLLLISINLDHQYIYNQKALNMIHYNFSDSLRIQRLTKVKVALIDEDISNKSLVHFTKLYKNQEGKKYSHGTTIANLLGARYDTNTGYQGLLPNITLYAYSIPDNEMNVSSLTEAIKCVTNWNVDIVCISMGTNKENVDLKNAILNTVHRGIIVICSSGNNPYDTNYPASFPIPGVISVGAIGNDYNILPYTNVNSQVDIYAPGEDIVSLTDNSSKVMAYSGTSVAVPFVTLACIYIKAFSPSLNPAEVENFLIQQTDSYLANWGNDQREIRVLNMKHLMKSLNIIQESEKEDL